MIIGIGTDLVEKKKLKKIYEKYPKRFSEKILSDCEKNIFSKLSSKKKVDFLCSSFSAKEAYVKALGTGFRNNLSFKDISILNDKKGKPYFLFNEIIKNILKKKYKLKKFKAHLSLSDEKKHSVSYVILEKLKWKK